MTPAAPGPARDGGKPEIMNRSGWHLVYLLGLGVLAGTAALLRTDGPRRAL